MFLLSKTLFVPELSRIDIKLEAVSSGSFSNFSLGVNFSELILPLDKEE